MTALLCLILIASTASAASFDCAKAATAVEKAVCASPRLSALDDELAAAYRGSNDREAQLRWIHDERDACESDTECIEGAYLVRIAELRLARHTFARSKPPASIIGRYAENDDYIDVARARGNQLVVKSEVSFPPSEHICSFEASPAEWVSNELRVAIFVPEMDGKCVLLLRFENGKVSTADAGNRCREMLCGARGGYSYVVLPIVK